MDKKNSMVSCSSLNDSFDGVLVWPRGGNTGDDLILLGCVKFLKTMGLNVWVSDGKIEEAAQEGDIEYLRSFFSEYTGYIFFPGGGNIGIYPNNEKVREMVIETASAAKGILVFSQSCKKVEASLLRSTVTVWARDTVSHKLLSEAGVKSKLVPDMALFLADEFPTISDGKGLFFISRAPNRCQERVEHNLKIEAAHADLTFKTPLHKIIKRLSPFKAIVSDRLHGGLISLMLGKRTAFLPVGYHKTLSFYETWLKDVEGVEFVKTQEELESFIRGQTFPIVDLKKLHFDVASREFVDFMNQTGAAYSFDGAVEVEPTLSIGAAAPTNFLKWLFSKFTR